MDGVRSPSAGYVLARPAMPADVYPTSKLPQALIKAPAARHDGAKENLHAFRQQPPAAGALARLSPQKPALTHIPLAKGDTPPRRQSYSANPRPGGVPPPLAPAPPRQTVPLAWISPARPSPSPAGFPPPASAEPRASRPLSTPLSAADITAADPLGVLDALDAIFVQDAGFQQLREYGLNKQLTRTKDGATDQSRIQELAELVKALRRCVRMYQDKVIGLKASLRAHEDAIRSQIALLAARLNTQRTAAAAGAASAADDAALAAEHAAQLAACREDAEARVAASQRAADAAIAAARADMEAQLRSVAGGASADDAAAAREELRRLREAYEAQRVDAAVARDEAAQLRAACEAQMGDVSTAREDARQLRATYEAQLREQRLQMKDAEYSAAHHQAAFKADIEKLQGRLHDEEAELSRVKRELQSEREQAAALSCSLRQAVSAQQRAEDELKRIRQRSEQELVQVQANKGEIWRALMQTKQRAEADERELRETLIQLEERADAAESRVMLLEGEKMQLLAERSAAAQQAAHSEREAASLQGRLLEAGKQAAGMTVQLSSLQSERDRLAGELAANEQQQRALSQQIVDLRAEALRLELQAQQSADGAEALQAQLDDLSAREATLRQDRQRLKDAVEQAVAQRDRLDACLAEAHEEAERLQEALRGAEARAEAQAAQLSEAVAAVDELRAALTHAEGAHVDQVERVQTLEGELEALREVVGCGDSGVMVGQLVSRVASLEIALADTERARRKLHNDLMELRGNIRVYCRVRPSSTARSVVETLPNCGVRLLQDGRPNDFHFDRVFGPGTGQAAVFDEVSDLVQSALDGYNVCLFSYGQTGSGKTHTMNGRPDSPELRGIVPRAVSKILATSQKLRAAGWEFKLEACFVEIYNENLKDLLADDGPRGGCSRLLDPNAIRHDPHSHTQVTGATKLVIETEEHAQEVLRRATKARSTDATAMNAASSRSHSVFTMHITGMHEASGSRLLGSLNLVDLAGSERLDRSMAEGQRQKETCAINKSLSSLGDIFQALASKSNHIPYRNSKLTYLLQPCLGGSGKTLMFVNIAPEVESAFESLCSLRFAAKVNTVETAARGGAKRNISSGLPPVPSTAGSSADASRPASCSVGPVKRTAPGPPPKVSAGFRSSSLPASKRRC